MTTETLAIWGAITGTLACLSSVFSFILKYSSFVKENSVLQIKTKLDYTYYDNLLINYKIIIISSSKLPITIECIKFYYYSKNIIKNILSYFYYKQGIGTYIYPLYNFVKLNEGDKRELELPLFNNIPSNIKKIKLIDHYGKEWAVPWYSIRKLKNFIKIQNIDNIEKINAKKKVTFRSYKTWKLYHLYITYNLPYEEKKENYIILKKCRKKKEFLELREKINNNIEEYINDIVDEINI